MDRHIIGIIPARMGSSRFPGKPLELIRGVPMLGHVYFRSKMSSILREVYIATPDQEIAEYAKLVGAKYIMTKDTHERASDRAAEATLKIEEDEGVTIDVVTIIQGDEPMIHLDMIDMAVKGLLEDEMISVLNLMAPIKTKKEFEDPNCPKVVVDKNSYALYFSREPIPSTKKWKGGEVKNYKQVCVIPFTRDYLFEYTSLEPTPLEKIESIDMNRVLEHGGKVKMIYQEFDTYCVDTPEDKIRVENAMENDNLLVKYQYCKGFDRRRNEIFYPEQNMGVINVIASCHNTNSSPLCWDAVHKNSLKMMNKSLEEKLMV